MYNYANEFININNDSFVADYFEKSYIKTYPNFESYIYQDNELFFAVKPYLKLSLEYLELTNLFRANIFNGVASFSKFKNIYFTYKFNNLEQNNFVLDFFVKNENKNIYEFDFLFLIKIFNDDFIERVNINNKVCFKLGINKPIYILSDSFVSVSYNNKSLYGDIIKKVQDKAVYFNYHLKVEKFSQVRLYIFSSYDYLAQFINLGVKNFIKNMLIVPKYTLDIVTSKNKIDIFIENLLKNYNREFYKYFHNEDYISELYYLMKFDKSLVRLKTNSDVKQLLVYLRYYSLYEESFTETTKNAIKAVNSNLSNLKINDYSTLLDVVIEIENIRNHKLVSELLKLKEKIVNQLKTINFSEILKTVDVCDFNTLLFIIKFAYYYDAKLLAKLYKKLNSISFFDIAFMKNIIKKDKENFLIEKYFNCLYYLYNQETKDVILKLILEDKSDSIFKLAIITDKMIGYNYKSNLIYILPNLPSSIEKMLFNYKYDNGIYTVIVKKGADFFSVNDKIYQDKNKVKATNGYIKIVCSSV